MPRTQGERVGSSGWDLRLCLFGDSYLQGVGDPSGAGWVTPVVEAAGGCVTAYRLGVRGDTSLDVQRRWYDEARCRLKDGDSYGVLFSFGVNDTYVHGGRTRVPHERSLTVLAAMLDEAQTAGWPAMVAGPVLPADGAHRGRVRRLSADMAAVCTDRVVPFVDLATPLDADQDWLGELAAGDRAHPGPTGYWKLANLIRPAFTVWIATLAEPICDNGYPDRGYSR